MDNPCVNTEFWNLGISFEDEKYYFLVYTLFITKDRLNLAYIDQKTNLVSSSKVDRTGETVKLVGMSDEEWERVQQVLSELANSDV